MTPIKTLLLSVLGTAVVGCTTYSPTEDPVALKLTDLEARMIRIERVLDNQSLVQLAGELSALRSETQMLRGELETLRYDSENTGERQRDLYIDVDQRLQALEQSRMAPPAAMMPGPAAAPAAGMSGAAAAGAAVGVAAASQGAVSGSDQEHYQAAFDLLRNSRYEEASAAFAQFLTNFARSPLADNAQYWLAETFYVRREFEQALGEFQKVIDGYPASAKLPDALLKIGFCHDELGRPEPARTALLQVARDFPDTTAARLATQRLERLGGAGG
jgi:tol-pal system protein YbgF